MANPVPPQGQEKHPPEPGGHGAKAPQPQDRRFAPAALGMMVRAVIHQAEEGGFWAEVPALPGCVTEGNTLEEVHAGLREAIQAWLEAGNDTAPKESHPSDRVMEIPL